MFSPIPDSARIRVVRSPERRAYDRRYRAENREKIRAALKAWHAANPGKAAEYTRRIKARDPATFNAKANARQRIYREKNKAKVSAAGKAYSAKWRLSWKLRVLSHYSLGTVACHCCGETTVSFLTLDHLNNDGKADRAGMKRMGIAFYRKLISQGLPDRPDLAVACFNCNLGRCVNGGVCPHKEAAKARCA